MILCSIPFSLIHLSLYQMPSSNVSPSSTAFITEDMSNPVLSPLDHSSGLSAQSFMCFLIFLRDCVTIYEQFFCILNSLFSLEASPASVHTTNFVIPKSFIIFFSTGMSEGCSFSLPGNMTNERGKPLPSIRSPI